MLIADVRWENPSPEHKTALETRFDETFTTRTCFAPLNQALTPLHDNTSELLLGLERPDIPLHDNDSTSSPTTPGF